MVITDKRKETVFETSDYGKFKLADWNRNVDEKKVTKLIKLISENGYKGGPIIVNDKYEICDGQHRYMACRSLKVPIQYIVRANFARKECTMLNELKTGWTMFDYLMSLAKSGDPDAKSFCKIIEDFKAIPRYAVMEVMSSGRWASNCDYRGVASAKFHISNECAIRACLLCVSDFKDIMNECNVTCCQKSMFRALARLYIIRDYISANNIDMNRMKKQFRKNVDEICRNTTTTDIVLDSLLEAYNKNLSNKSRTFASAKEFNRAYKEYQKCMKNS